MNLYLPYEQQVKVLLHNYDKMVEEELTKNLRKEGVKIPPLMTVAQAVNPHCSSLW